MKALLEYIVKAIVDSPNEVSVKEVLGEKSVVFEIKVASADVGKVIGRNGRIINSIRTLLRAASVKEGKKVSVELIG
ncbi:MAG: KH domain-containing protein [bacterium]